MGVVAIATLAISVVGCAPITQSLRPRPKVIAVDAPVARVDVELKGEQLAPGRPPSLPLWPGSTVVVSAETPTPQGKSWTATLVTPDDFDDVVAGLAAGLEDAGWTAEVSDASDGGQLMTLLSAVGASAEALFTVDRSAEASVTSIDIVVTPKR